MVTLTRTSNTPYAVAYDHAPIRGIANEAKSIPREWINAHGNDIRQELYNYLYPLIQGEVSLTYQNGVPVYMPVPHLKPDTSHKKESFMAKQTTSLRVLRGILCGTGAAVIGVYAGFCVYYHGHYFPHTTIGGISCGNQTAVIWKQKTLLPRKITSCT